MLKVSARRLGSIAALVSIVSLSTGKLCNPYESELRKVFRFLAEASSGESGEGVEQEREDKGLRVDVNAEDGALMDERMSEIIQHNGSGVLLVSIENMEAFREAYGFVASDVILRAISLMIVNTMREVCGPADFLGTVAAPILYWSHRHRLSRRSRTNCAAVWNNPWITSTRSRIGSRHPSPATV